MRTPQLGVLGPSASNLPRDSMLCAKLLDNAEEVGRRIAQAKAILITGGMDGAMEAACRGAKEAGGITVGTPGRERGMCNPHVIVEICTPIDVGDLLFAGSLSCDALIVFPGGAGTLAEVALTYRFRKPMIIMRGYSVWYDELVGKPLDQSSNKLPFLGADTPEEAVSKALIATLPS